MATSVSIYCDCCREIAANTVITLQDATLETLRGKQESIDYNFLPEDAQDLLKYRNADSETWQTLSTFRQLILSYPEK